MERKLINRIQRVMGYGMTCPLHIVANDGKDYILKTRIKTFDSNDKPFTSSKELFAEIFSYLYLNALNASYIPKFCLLEVNDETLSLAQKFANSQDEREKQAYENLKVSKGLNLGVEFILNASKPFTQINFTQEFKRLTINYDARLMNTDRSAENPNILKDSNEKHWLIDFGLALDSLYLFEELVSKTGLFGANEIYFDKCCFRDYLFNEIERKNIKHWRSKIDKVKLDNIIQNICKITHLFEAQSQEQEYLAQIIAKREQSKRIFNA
ncbi:MULTISPECIES: HipA family kinase [Helicobacter]|uniref:HipA family kinase n=1 Tax=Helicobacter TaxID=209 RepID=UPI0011C03DB3|nr:MULTISPECIES: HipA family kinase [Helicobacter]